MKPELSSSNITSEKLPSNIMPDVEKMPVLGSPEKALEKGTEVYERNSDLNAIRADVGLSTVIPMPVINDATTNDGGMVMTDNPIVANDDDLIEKEWVDKAKKIVADTQDDPHKRKHEVGKLQVDYLKKRFGRELGVAE